MGVKLTAPQRELLEAVRDGQCQRWGAGYVTAILPGERHWRTVTARANKLRDLGLIELCGKAMPEGKRWPDWYEVQLTTAGREAAQ